MIQDLGILMGVWFDVWFDGMFLKQVFKRSTVEKKAYYLIGDLNINFLEYIENEKVSTFYNSLFECGAIALINKPT